MANPPDSFKSIALNPAPLVTVIMPVFNAEAYVNEAIKSILNQTYENLELLIADDGSTDGSRKIISSFNDKRLRPFYFDTNHGYVAHLNHFLQEANGKYIARMDADDISFPERLSKQVEYLENNLDVGLCGTQLIEFDNEGLKESSSYPSDDASLRVHLLSNSMIAHPTVMFRRSIIEDHQLQYDAAFVPAEDYRLWYSITKVCKVANLPLTLLRYRRHQNQITQTSRDKQRRSVDRIRALVLSDLMGYVSEGDMNLHLSLLNGNYVQALQYVVQARRWLLSILERNDQVALYDRELLAKLLGDVFFAMCTHLYKLGWPVAREYLTSDLRSTHDLTMKLKLVMKCLLRSSPFAKSQNYGK